MEAFLVIVGFLIIVGFLLLLVSFAAFMGTRCDHTWEDKHEVTIVEEEGSLPHAKVYVQRCRSCGKYRRQRVEF